MIELRPELDAQVIKEALVEPELWERISEDGTDQEIFTPPVGPGFVWLAIITEDGLAGYFFFHQLSLTTVKFHAHILKDYREKWSKKAGLLGLEYFAYNLNDRIHKMVAEIPVCYKDVYHYSLNHGLSDEGLNRKSVMKNGELMDQHLLGITKQEAIDFLKERGVQDE